MKKDISKKIIEKINSTKIQNDSKKFKRWQQLE